MKERPILFSAEMVRAILDGRKTQTRRVAKLNASGRVKLPGSPSNWHCEDPDAVLACPYGQPGDRLWVRETFRVIDGQTQPRIAIDYRADPEDKWCRIGDFLCDGKKWTPSIYMPRLASRILLEITNVRVERVQEISDKDCLAEGIADLAIPLRPDLTMYRSSYADLWDSINAKRGFGWDANPWVWVIEFRRIE
jgi:hypothetical protein